jgi:hypothetical protein
MSVLSTITETQLTRHRSRDPPPRTATATYPGDPPPSPFTQTARHTPLSIEDDNGTCRSWMCGSPHESQGRATWRKLNQGHSLVLPVSWEGHSGIGAHDWNTGQSRSTSPGRQTWLGPTCWNSQIAAAPSASNNTINRMAYLQIQMLELPSTEVGNL